jgi:hypothetical protein
VPALIARFLLASVQIIVASVALGAAGWMIGASSTF